MKVATKFTFVFSLLLLFFVWSTIARSPGSSETKIYYFDVGQGNTTLIQRGNHQILIDGGPDDQVLAELSKSMPLYDRTIEMVVLTHPHADHLTGLNLVLDRYKIDKIYSTGVSYDTNTYLNFLNKVEKISKESGTLYIVPEIGQKLEVYDSATLEFFWPGEKYKDIKEENLNNTSIVSRFCVVTSCALFMGDLETDRQDEMIVSNPEISSDIIKISHHGSVNGTNAALLDWAKPQYAVISVGADNKFGHPHQNILNLINERNIKLLRTDQDGTTVFTILPNAVILQ